MNCRNCGIQLRVGARFCGQCGAEQASSVRTGETGPTGMSAEAPSRPVGTPRAGVAPRVPMSRWLQPRVAAWAPRLKIPALRSRPALVLAVVLIGLLVLVGGGLVGAGVLGRLVQGNSVSAFIAHGRTDATHQIGVNMFVNNVSGWNQLSGTVQSKMRQELESEEKQFLSQGSHLLPSRSLFTVKRLPTQQPTARPVAGLSAPAGLHTIMLTSAASSAPDSVTFGPTIFGDQPFGEGAASYAGYIGSNLFGWVPCVSSGSNGSQPGGVVLCGGWAYGFTGAVPAGGMGAAVIAAAGFTAAQAVQPLMATFTTSPGAPSDVTVTGAVSTISLTLSGGVVSAGCAPSSVDEVTPGYGTLSDGSTPGFWQSQVTTCANTVVGSIGFVDLLFLLNKLTSVLSGVTDTLHAGNLALTPGASAAALACGDAGVFQDIQTILSGIKSISEVLVPAPTPTCQPTALPTWSGRVPPNQTLEFDVAPQAEAIENGAGATVNFMFSFATLTISSNPSGGASPSPTPVPSLPLACQASGAVPLPAINTGVAKEPEPVCVQPNSNGYAWLVAADNAVVAARTGVYGNNASFVPPMTMRGTSYSHGVAVNAEYDDSALPDSGNSQVLVYNLAGNYGSFSALVGLDDGVNRGPMEAQFFRDGSLVASVLVHPGDSPKSVSFALQGAQVLTIKVSDLAGLPFGSGYGPGQMDIVVPSSAVSGTPSPTASPSPTPTSIATPSQSPPIVSGLFAASGPTAGGSPVIVSGSGFSGATGVRFGSKSASFYVQGTIYADAELTAYAPPGSGTVDVTVTTPAGTSAITSADQYSYIAPSGTAQTQVSLPYNATCFGDTGALPADGTGVDNNGATLQAALTPNPGTLTAAIGGTDVNFNIPPLGNAHESCVRLVDSAPTVSINVPSRQYSRIFFLYTGGGSGHVTLALNYQDGSSTNTDLTIDSWCQLNIPPLLQAGAVPAIVDQYRLVRGGQLESFSQNCGAFALGVATDPTKVLTSFTLTKGPVIAPFSQTNLWWPLFISITLQAS